MGVVWRATQVALDRPVAVKVIAPRLAEDVAFRERFQRESQIAASIEHPNVIPIYEAGELEGTLYLIMRWVDGTDLGGRLLATGPIEPGEAIRLLRPVASALAAAHRRGLIHRDVKPANVLIATGDQDQDEHVYLTDFGIARRSDTHGMTRTGVLVGTVDYMSPERIEGAKGTPASDIYAFGCMLYETLSGRLPFDRPAELAKMFAHINDPVPADQLPAALAPIVLRAMAKRPEDRFASAGELVAALDRAAAPTTVSRQPPGTAEGSAATVLAPAEAQDPTVMAPTARAVPTGTDDPTVMAPAAATPPPPAATPPRDATPAPTASTAPSDPQPRSRAKLLGALALLAVVAVIAVVVATSGGGNIKSASTPSTGTPAASHATAAVKSGNGVHVGTPTTLASAVLAIAAAGQNAWIATDGRLTELGGASGTDVVNHATTPGPATAAAVDGRGRVWLAGLGGKGISQTTPSLILAGGDSRALTIGSTAAWIVAGNPNTVGRVDLGGLGASQPIAVTGPIATLGDAYARTWVASRNGAVSVLGDDGSHDALPAPNVTAGTVGVAESNGVWFLSSSGRLDRIDPRVQVAVAGHYKAHLAPVRVGGGAGGLGSAPNSNSIWVLSRADRTLTRIGTNGSTDEQVTAKIAFSATPGHLAVGDHMAWVDIPTTHEVYPITF
jgi:hypothetical protein